MCNCLELANEQLKEHNTRVTTSIGITGGQFKFLGVEISTHKIDEQKRGKAMKLTAAYCPFCGQKYESS